MVSVSCFGARVSVMFHFMFVHYTFSSVSDAKWPRFWEIAARSVSNLFSLYTDLQKKPVSHFPGQYWRGQIRYEKIFYIIFFNNHFCINSLKFIKILMKSDLAMRHSLGKGSF